MVGAATWSDFPKLEPQPTNLQRKIAKMSSPLVEAFTSPEREALSKFKADYLQRALNEASGDSSSASSLEIWNVPITQDDPRVDVIIVKFLRAK
jgi:hypothetical protein